jgi:exonuclease V gamma subunit
MKQLKFIFTFRGAKMTNNSDPTSYLSELINAYKIGEKNDLICFDTYQSLCPQPLEYFP